MSFLKGPGFVHDADAISQISAYPEGAREAMEAQSTAIGFLDRFDRLDRYASASGVVHMTTLPEVGPAWRSRIDPGPEPTVVTQGLTCGDSVALYYLSNSVPTSNGKLSLGFEFSIEKTSSFGTGLNQLGLNVTYGLAQLIADDRTIGAGLALEPVHINFNPYGITSIAFYGGDAVPCVNGTYNGSHIPWNLDGDSMGFNGRMVLLLKAEGEYLEITLVGVGSLLFKHADLASKIGSSSTHFWWEPNGGAKLVGGTGFKYAAKLHRVWGNAEELDQRPDYGSAPGGNLSNLAGLGPHTLPGVLILPEQLRMFPTGSDLTGDAWPSGAFQAIAAGNSTSTRAQGAKTRINGGHIGAEGGFISQVGNAELAESAFGRAPVAVFRTGSTVLTVTAVRNSTSGTLADFGGVHIINGLEAGDQEEWIVHLNLAGTNPKRLLIDFTVYLNTIFDSDISGTPLTAITGPCILKITRISLTAVSHLMVTSFQLPDGTFLPLQRVSIARGTPVTSFYMRFRTTCDANAIVQESLRHLVIKQSIS